MFQDLFHRIFCLLFMAALLPLHFAGAVDLPFVGERTEPKYKDITFWDAYKQEQRGIRALLYTVLTDQKNRMVDQRLHKQFVNFLGYMCQEVITLESIEEPTRKRMVENVLVGLVDQWKLNGRIDPNALFQPLPFLDVDVLVLMERTVYDQLWRENDKKLIIGLNVAAFELDLGEPLYTNRFVTEVPWTGEDTSYVKAERRALLKVTDAIGETFQQAAYIINEAHRREASAREKAQSIAEQERKRVLLQEREELKKIVREAKSVLDKAPSDTAVVTQLQQEVGQLEPLIKLPVKDLTDEQIKKRRELAYNVQVHTNQLRENHSAIEDPSEENQQAAESVQKPAPEVQPEFPTGFQPFEKSELKSGVSQNLNPVPSPSNISGNIFDRSWLLPNNRQENSSSQTGQKQTNALGNQNVQGTNISGSPQSATNTVISATKNP